MDRLNNSSLITLNNTAGTNTITGRNGLWAYNQNQNGNRRENVGPIALGAGRERSSQGNTGTGTGSATVMDLVADTLTRGSDRAACWCADWRSDHPHPLKEGSSASTPAQPPLSMATKSGAPDGRADQYSYHSLDGW